MRKIKNQNLEQLLVQLKFTPEKKCLEQLDAAEKLFTIIDKDKEYPFEFVFFRITGFHPAGTDTDELIKGDVLLNDLQVFLSRLSNRLARPITEQKEKYYTVDELAKNMGVSIKTVYRWRDRGLLAKKYIFKNGKVRICFLKSTVDKFLKDNPNLLKKAKNYGRLTEAQKQKIIKQAEKLSAEKALSRNQIIKKISSEFGKCHETIRYILLSNDKANAEKSGATYITGAIDPAQAAEIYRLFKQGCKVKELMKRFNRNKSSIYRIINQRKARALLARKIEFIPSDEFLEEDAKEKILVKPVHIENKSSAEPLKQFELDGTHILPEYLQVLKDTPVLTREREVELFRRYNYLKYLAFQTRIGIKPNLVSGTILNQIEQYLTEAEEIKRRIVEANLRLVISIAGKHMATGTDFSELVSKGNFALINAVEEFDYSMGVRFSRRASLTIAKEYAKLSGKITGSIKARAGAIKKLEQGAQTLMTKDFAAIERAHQSLTQVIEDNLTEREQHVILNRFGLIGSPIKKETKTLKQIGEELGLSKERVRQVELTALQKLRQSLSSAEFELLIG
ncbi:MAG: sigma-70 family RNA polymerase sigma factor [Sedimentisphaerales bacterium]|nr:sigma-70 family RNA polymerase sigma factor [Sedimentisphaerales bacterium]